MNIRNVTIIRCWLETEIDNLLMFIYRVMLDKQKQQQIVKLFNYGTPEHNLNFLKHSGGRCGAKKV